MSNFERRSTSVFDIQNSVFDIISFKQHLSILLNGRTLFIFIVRKYLVTPGR